MALNDNERAALAVTVAGRIAGSVLGREESGGTVEQEIAGAAVDLCCDLAPNAPDSILREACVRLAGWMYGSRPHVTEESFKDPSGTETMLRFHAAATANGMRASGAGALLSRYVETARPARYASGGDGCRGDWMPRSRTRTSEQPSCAAPSPPTLPH